MLPWLLGCSPSSQAWVSPRQRERLPFLSRPGSWQVLRPGVVDGGGLTGRVGLMCWVSGSQKREAGSPEAPLLGPPPPGRTPASPSRIPSHHSLRHPPPGGPQHLCHLSPTQPSFLGCPSPWGPHALNLPSPPPSLLSRKYSNPQKSRENFTADTANPPPRFCDEHLAVLDSSGVRPASVRPSIHRGLGHSRSFGLLCLSPTNTLTGPSCLRVPSSSTLLGVKCICGEMHIRCHLVSFDKYTCLPQILIKLYHGPYCHPRKSAGGLFQLCPAQPRGGCSLVRTGQCQPVYWSWRGGWEGRNRAEPGRAFRVGPADTDRSHLLIQL